ncbi:MAG: ATP phosphoribosyltransferase [Chloroflexi bacterium]|nr:MAG: ATP phosphoribosyltransferase [Chloroflexota bacterium]
MAVTKEQEVRLALPGKGTLEASTLSFLAECGMKVNRSNPRQYLARIASMPGLEVVFQRAADIPMLVLNGDATLGITGYDILAEHLGYSDDEIVDGDNGEDIIVLERNLDYGTCRLVVAVPETWIDVSTCADLWHLAGYYATQKGRGLRIATKYPILTGQFLRRHGITHCKIVSPHGALEAAPLTDTADLIVDLTETGTTLRENHLKLLDDGIVLRSQACLIANAQLLNHNKQALRIASMMLELIDARMQARNRSLLTAHLQVEGSDGIQRICQQLKSRIPGFEFRVASSDGRGLAVSEKADPNGCTISGVVRVGNTSSELLEAVAILRSMGALHIDVTPLTYRFERESVRVRSLHERLKRLH